MAAQVTEAQLPTSEATREQCDRDEAEQMAEACSSKALMGPNVQGNRRAAPMLANEKACAGASG
jgi:epoxyqueuosine reductase QueG